MSGLFGSSKAPPPPPPPAPPPPPPSVDQARQSRMMADQAARRKGRGATVLTSGLLTEGDEPKTATRKLLGE
jgi:hypothetical protein